jgi:methylornithine synthase
MLKMSGDLSLTNILEKAADRLPLAKEEVIYLLDLQEESEIENLFDTARRLRQNYFGNKVFLYGFIYFSTFCRNNCTFCLYRRSNSSGKRYRKSREEILDTGLQLAESGVHLLDLTMGEDPHFFSNGHFADLIETVAAVKESCQLPLMISPGVVPKAVLEELYNSGVDWYACYQETHNRELYARLRINQSYDERLELKEYARKLGFLIEEGLLAGLGETTADLYHSFQVMDRLSADQVRVMSFIPQEGTPLKKLKMTPRLREMLIIAVMRLLFPDKLIPGSLDVDGIAGLKSRLNAGANVITSIIPPQKGFLGVSQSTLNIDEGSRSVAGTIPILEECGLEPASRQGYTDWLDQAKKKP